MGWLGEALKEWGDWVARDIEHSGYPPVTALARVIIQGGGGRTQPEHRILSLDWPRLPRTVHVAVNKLEMKYQLVLFAKYVMHIDDNGVRLTIRDKARIVGITKPSFEKRLYRAKNLVRAHLDYYED